MDTGVIVNGYRWEIEDHTATDQGYTAKIWRADQPSSVTARPGFTTRGAAVAWVADEDERLDPRLAAMFVGAVLAVSVLGIAAAMMSAGRGGRSEVQITARFERSRGGRGGVRARPTRRAVTR